ncbi:MAG: ABC transporter ATP-binding protein, partial [Myxococcota bacterium]
LPPPTPAEIEAASSAEAPLETFAQAAQADGSIRCSTFSAPIDAVLGTLSEERPLLTETMDGQLVALVQRLGNRICIEDSEGRQWLNESELRTRLVGVSAPGGRELTWLSLVTAPSSALGEAESPWKGVRALLEGEGSNVLAIVTYAIGVGLLSLTLPLAVQTLVNTVAFGQLLQPSLVLTLMLAAGLVFAAALHAMQSWVVEVVQRRIFVRLVSDLADRLPRAHIGAFERGSGPELVNRFFDVFTAQKALSGLLVGGVEALLTALVGVIVLAFYHPILLGFGVILTIATTFVLFLMGRGGTHSAIRESKTKYAVAGWLQEMARHPFALKAHGGADYARRRLDRLAANWLTDRADHFRIFYRQLLGALGLQVIAHATLLGVGGWLVVSRELSIGQLVAAELIVTAIVVSLSKLGNKLETAYDLVAAVDKLGALLAVPLEDPGGDDAFYDEGPVAVEFRQVSSEGGGLRNLTARIEAGATVALHGSRRVSSAVVDVLFGLRRPEAGVVLLDGHDVRDVRQDRLRTRVAVVREPEIVPGTIADNVRVANLTLSTQEIWKILRIVGLEEVVRGMSEGLRTKLNPSGVPLNRLESLRLTLARSLAGRPDLLILDGVVDALPERERKPLLDNITMGRTLIVTTHEMNVVNDCDHCIELGAL